MLEISAHFAEVYGASLSKDTVSRIARQGAGGHGGLDKPTAAAGVCRSVHRRLYVRVRDGQVGDQPFHAAIGVDLAGHRDVLGLWAGGGGGESANFWMSVLTDLKNRGVADVFYIVCDGLRGLPDSATAVFPTGDRAGPPHPPDPRHLPIRPEKKYWEQVAKDLKPIFTAPSAAAAWAAFEGLEEKWGTPYPAIGRLWRAAWEQFTPLLDYDLEIRKVLCSTNAIESLNARYRRAGAVKGHFPTE